MTGTITATFIQSGQSSGSTPGMDIATATTTSPNTATSISTWYPGLLLNTVSQVRIWFVVVMFAVRSATKRE